jgi:hypothetical protein
VIAAAAQRGQAGAFCRLEFDAMQEANCCRLTTPYNLGPAARYRGLLFFGSPPVTAYALHAARQSEPKDERSSRD